MTRSYVSGISHHPLLDRTIGAELDRVAAEHPDVEAVVALHQDVRYSYAELHAAVEEAARALLALGVEKGDRVGMWSANRIEWLVMQYATAKAGAVLVNVNPAYRNHELRYALRQSGCSVLIAARAFRDTDYVAMIDTVRSDLPGLREVVLLDPGSHPGTRSWTEFLDLAARTDTAALRAREAMLDIDDAINIQ